MTSCHSVMICLLYVLLEAGFYVYHKSTVLVKSDRPRIEKSARVELWKCELVSRAANGIPSVNDWVDGWFENSSRAVISGIRRGNVEHYISGKCLTPLFGIVLTCRTSFRSHSQGGSGGPDEASCPDWLSVRAGA